MLNFFRFVFLPIFSSVRLFFSLCVSSLISSIALLFDPLTVLRNYSFQFLACVYFCFSSSGGPGSSDGKRKF